MKSRIKDKERGHHWSMQLAFNNLAVDSAYMVICNHIAENLECLSDNNDLLDTITNNFFRVARFPELRGPIYIMTLEDPSSYKV